MRVPALAAEDLVDDAFGAIARDGAGLLEVQIRLQKTLRAIAELPDDGLARAAKRMSRIALSRAGNAIDFKADLDLITAASDWSA